MPAGIIELCRDQRGVVEHEHQRVSVLPDAVLAVARPVCPAISGAGLSKNGSPVAAILTSGACILVAAAVSMLTPYAYN